MSPKARSNAVQAGMGSQICGVPESMRERIPEESGVTEPVRVLEAVMD